MHNNKIKRKPPLVPFDNDISQLFLYYKQYRKRQGATGTMAEHPRRKFTIGIDVGGTNTDGVLYDTEKKTIAACTKEPTDHHDYKRSIDSALRKLLRETSPQEIISLNISTTLSTNALLEGKGSPVALVLIGYDDFPHIKEEILSAVSPLAFITAHGGHTSWGEEREPLDMNALAGFAKEHAGSFFAVSSLYSPRNPIHESKAAEIIRNAGCAGITCGHEMARSRLNSVKRTISAYLNSSLIDVTHKLISGVEFCAASYGLSCPVMFLRSDSSLVGGSWCSRFPLETIFSGPAASMRGAALLAEVQEGDALIADMGGTSTDIGRVSGGNAVFSAEGATIGAYRTMIPSLEIHSAALGGDSIVRISDDGRITIGPERTVPYCRALPGSECGFTPTDAVAALGAHQLGNWEKSAEAAREMGEKLGLSGDEFARMVRGEVSAKLDREFGRQGKGRRICVGAPAAAYSESAGCCVPPLASIASAAGAASSSLSLSCLVSIQHSFMDDKFYAFLPGGQINGFDLESILSRARSELDTYLTKCAEEMGFYGAAAEIDEDYEYIGRGRELSFLSAVTLHGRAVV